MLRNLNQESNQDFQAFLQKLETKEFTGVQAQLTILSPNGHKETCDFVFGNVLLALSWGRTYIEDIAGSIVYQTSYVDFLVFKLSNTNWFYFEESNGNKVTVEFIS